jgi:hypothetical protein
MEGPTVFALGANIYLRGECTNGTFQFPGGSSTSGEVPGDDFFTIGQPFTVTPELFVGGPLGDCTGGKTTCLAPYVYTGPLSQSITGAKMTWTLYPITAGVSYTTASGKVYSF